MNEARYIAVDGQPSGPFELWQLQRMSEDREISPNTLFWSDMRQEWRPLTAILFDIYPQDHSDIDQSIFKTVEVLGTGRDTECDTCKDLAGQTFPSNQIPELPPHNCQCIPWCMCDIVVSELQ